MSRLLTSLILYRSGYLVGRYISVEKKIEETKETYHDVLSLVSDGSHEGRYDYTTPLIKYFLGIILNCYKKLERRIGCIDFRSTPYDM